MSDKKMPSSRLAKSEKRNLLFVNEHFSDKRNEELSVSDLLSASEKIGVFLLTLFKN